MNNIILKWFMIACAVVVHAANDARESRTVMTRQGPVRGYKYDDVFKFYGIPYATAPTGPNRFKAPLPGPVRMQALEAVDNKIICPQVDVSALNKDNMSFKMQENCLVANIHTPGTEEKNLPVLVYVHGGGYNIGYGELMTPHTLVKSKKIVGVTFNYRLGAHGFLCLGTETAPGNAGMKDQVALLRWVRDNIADFGGNPNEVTIAGCCGGSSAVDLIMLSQMADGLFNKVIAEGGASVAVWSVQQDPVQNAKEFARHNNFTNVDNIEELEGFFKSATYDLLMSDLFMDRPDSTVLFSPCVEQKIGVETFLEDTPVSILKQGNFKKVPVLYGYANLAGLARIELFPEWKDKMNERFSDFLPADLKFQSEAEKTEVAQSIKEFYFGHESVEEGKVQGYIDFFTDVMFAYPHLRSTELQVAAGSNSIYLYDYSFHFDTLTKLRLPEFVEKIKGANHCALSVVVYDMTIEQTPNLRKNNLKVRKTLIEMWLNFIITGKPVPEGSRLPAWPPVGGNWSPHMDLGNEIKLKGSLLEKRARFWDGIYEQYYKSPVSPSQHGNQDELFDM